MESMQQLYGFHEKAVASRFRYGWANPLTFGQIRRYGFPVDRSRVPTACIKKTATDDFPRWPFDQSPIAV